jgi:uroporphyrin-3 C-methyltransferase
MSDTPPPPSADTPTVNPPPPAAGLGQGVAWLALLVALAAGGAAAWLVWQARTQPAAAALGTLETQVRTLGEQGATAAALAPRLDAVQTQLSQIEQRLQVAAQQRAELEQRLGQVTGMGQSAETAQVAQAVAAAWQVAQATGSSEALQRALNQGAARLAQSPEAAAQQLASVLVAQARRQAQSGEQEASSVARRLGELQQQLGGLALSLGQPRLVTAAVPAPGVTQAPATEPAAESSWQGVGATMADWAQALWRDLAALVQVQRHQGGVQAVDDLALRQRVTLRLLLARGAVLAADAAQAQAELQRVVALVQPVATDPSTQQWLEQVQQQAQHVAIGLRVPEPTEALRALGLK